MYSRMTNIRVKRIKWLHKWFYIEVKLGSPVVKLVCKYRKKLFIRRKSALIHALRTSGTYVIHTCEVLGQFIHLETKYPIQ